MVCWPGSRQKNPHHIVSAATPTTHSNMHPSKGVLFNAWRHPNLEVSEKINLLMRPMRNGLGRGVKYNFADIVVCWLEQNNSLKKELCERERGNKWRAPPRTPPRTPFFTTYGKTPFSRIWNGKREMWFHKNQIWKIIYHLQQTARF